LAVVLFIGTTALAWQEKPSPDRSQDVRLLLTEGLYTRAEAEARSQVAQRRTQFGEDSLEACAASDLLVRALTLNGHATSDETLALARDTLRFKEAKLGSTHQDLIESLLNLGDVLAERADFDEALAITERAVALRHASSDPNSLDVADALDHLGAIRSDARRDDALATLEISLQLKERLLAANDTRIARTLEDIGLVLQRKGEYEKSGVLVRRAASIQEAARVDHPAYARTQNLIAQQLWFEGRLIESREASERAVAVAERTLRPDHPTVALSLRYLAATLSTLGDLEHAKPLAERALAIAEKNYGANHHVTAEYLVTLGSAGLQEGDYTTARTYYRRALRIFETRYGLWHEFDATTLSMLARTDARLGDYASARREQSRAVAIHERVGGPNHPYVATALTELANVYRQDGRSAQALPLLERALAIREMNHGPDHRDVARTLTNMASTLAQVGQTTRARAAATRAIAIWERLEAPNAPDYATALGLYADLQARAGNYIAARDYYARAMAIRARAFGTSNPLFADAQAGFALALANTGDPWGAFTNAANAEATGRTHLRTMLRSLPERQSLEYAAVRPRALDLVLSLTDQSQATDLALDGVVRGRALVLDEMAARQRSERTAIEGTDPLRVAFSSAQQRLANLVVRGPGQMSSAQYATLVEDARRESELAEQALAERNSEFKAERSRAQLGLDDVRSSLPPDTALVSFVRYEQTIVAPTGASRTGASRSRSQRAPSYIAFILRANGPAVAVKLGAAQTIDSLVAEWRADIAGEAGPAGAAPSPSRSRVSGLALRRLIWDPLTPHVAAARRVFIVPDGSLSLVPFAALPTGQRSYLIERAPVLHYLSAERDLVPSPVEGFGTGKGLLALGGPAFDDATSFGSGQGPLPPSSSSSRRAPIVRPGGSGCDSVQAITFPSLSGTLKEVNEVSHLWAASTVSNAEGSRVLVGREASEPTLKQDAHRYRVLHFATHGFFLRDTCPPAPAGTRAVGGLVDMSNPQVARLTVENPLLLSGLALAGANHRQAAGPAEDDGILTAEEVASLDLGRVEWAVLSACDTGLGLIKAGEGVFGLRRAFQIAGARTVIMSLWSVEDDSTRLWMHALYESRLQRNLSTAEAMREASLSVLRARRAAGQSTIPFFWAAFVAAGDWR
jgi:CHAT domain-containing protein/tetratricopeptide (TPR) repeat protein